MAWPVRYRIIRLLFCSSVVNYVDRVNISVAAPVIMRETGWDKGRFGLVFSAFLIGYALLQIPGGVIADRWSARKILALSFCGFSLFTALTPLGQHAFFLLLALRFLVGAFESVTFPSLTSLNSRWIPRPEFGRAQTFSVSGLTVGQMVAYPLTTWIVLHFSWPVVFYVNYIESNLAPKPAVPLPLRAVFTAPPIFILSLSYMCFAYIGWMFLFWFPTYLVEARGMSLGVMGAVGVLLHGAGFVGIISGGAISDWLLRKGWSPQFARARFAGIGVALSLPFLLSAAIVPSTPACVIVLALFYFLFASALAGYTTVSLEFNPHLAGSIFGMINTLGSFAGIFGPMTAGFMLTQSGGNWLLPFFVATAVGVVCAAILFVVPIRPIKVETFAPTVVAAREAAR